MMSLPSIAVVIPCHNYGDFLGEAIESVLAQSVAADDIVVVLDRCSDHSAEVAAKYVNAGARTIHVACRNIYLARRAGFRSLNAEIVCFLDADDRLSANYFERGLVEFADPDVGIVTGDCQEFGYRDQRGTPDIHGDPKSTNPATSAALVRRQALVYSEAFEQFSYIVAQGEDECVWRHVLQSGWKIRHAPIVHEYRRHDRNVSLTFEADWAEKLRQHQGFQPEPRIKMLFLTPTIATGGVHQNTCQKMRYARRLKWVATVLDDHGPSDSDAVANLRKFTPCYAGLPHASSNAHDLDRTKSVVERLQELSHQVDAVYMWGSTSQAVIEQLRSFKTVILGLHGEGEWTRNIANQLAPVSHAFYAVCQAAKKLIPPGGHQLTRVIRNAVDLASLAPTMEREQVRASWKVEPGQIAVGFIGRISGEKNPLAFVDAVMKMPERFVPIMISPQVDATRVSHAPELRAQVEACGRGRLVWRVGHPEAMGNIYAGLDCLVVPSHEEGGPLVTLEAWASGVPVVSTPVGILPSLEREYGGLAVTIPLAPTAVQIQQGILFAVSAAFRPTVERAREFVWNHHSATRMTHEWEELVATAVAGTSSQQSFDRRISPSENHAVHQPVNDVSEQRCSLPTAILVQKILQDANEKTLHASHVGLDDDHPDFGDTVLSTLESQEQKHRRSLSREGAFCEATKCWSPLSLPPESDGKPCRVLWLLADLTKGGIGTYTANMFRSLLNDKIKATAVVFYTWNELTTDLSLATTLSHYTQVICTDEKIISEEVRRAHPYISFQPGPGIYDQLLENCDVVTTASNNPHVLARKSWPNKPLIVQLHSVCKLTHHIANTLGPYATHFLVFSQQVFEKAISSFGLPRQKVTLSELAIDANRVANWRNAVDIRRDLLRDSEHSLAPGFAEKAHWALFFGRFSPEKRIPLIAQTVKILNERGQSWVGLFVGDGWQSETIKAEIRATIPHHSLLAPWTDRLGEILHAADAFFCTSEYEGGPYTSLEALIAGVPVLSADVGILRTLRLPRYPGGYPLPVYRSLGENPTAERIADRVKQTVGRRAPLERRLVDSYLARQVADRFCLSRQAETWRDLLKSVTET